MSTKVRALAFLVAGCALATGPPEVFGAEGEFILVDTDAMTITGDGDDDPAAFKGQPFTTAELPNGLAGFFFGADVTIADGELVRVRGPRGKFSRRDRHSTRRGTRNAASAPPSTRKK